MKLLLDEQIPRKLARYFPETWTALTVQEMLWAGISNGELLSLAAANDFHAMITADKNLQDQQNVANLPLAVVVLAASSTRIEDLSPLIPQTIDVLRSDLEPQVYHVGSK